MTRLRAAITELQRLEAVRLASIGSALLSLLDGSQSTVRSLDHMRWAESRLQGALDSLNDLAEISSRSAAIGVFVREAIEGIGEIRSEIR